MLAEMSDARCGADLPRLALLAVAATPLVILLSALVPARPALAQEEQLALSVSLASQPIFYEQGDNLDLDIRVRNSSSQALDGFGLQVTAYDKVSSRSALHESFDGTALGSFAAFPKSFDQRVAPGASTVVSIDDPVSELAPLNQTPDGGVFPMTISLLDNNGVTTDSFTTQLIYYPSAVETPLNMVFVVPLNSIPARSPAGVFGFDSGPDLRGRSLAEGLLSSGWLSSTVDAIDRLADKKLEVALAPTPRLIDEVADLENGYRADNGESVQEVSEGPVTKAAGAFLDRLRALLQRPGVQPLLVPYSFPDLPALEAHAPEDLGPQLKQAEDVLGSVLQLDLGRSWVFPPAGRVDADTLERLALAGIDNLFFSPRSLEEADSPLTAGCPEPVLSFACPVMAKSTFGGSTRGYVGDADLQARLASLARSGSDRLELQKFFAETAVIREELPGRTDRIINAALPAHWQPSARMIKLLYRGLATAPWLRTITPKQGLLQGIEVAERQPVDMLPESPNQLGSVDYGEIVEASEVVQSFSRMEPPAPLVQRLQRNILVAESRSWWSDEALAAIGPDYASSAAAEAAAEMDKISVAINKVVLTSSKGEILLSIVNSADYPVHALIRVDSLKLAPDPALIDAYFEPGLTREFVDVTARATGIFSLEVTITTPDEYPIQRLSRPVRSTEFNRIALGITVGALAFLIGFYIMRWSKRRHNRSSPAPSVESA